MAIVTDPELFTTSNTVHPGRGVRASVPFGAIRPLGAPLVIAVVLSSRNGAERTPLPRSSGDQF
eukprot:7041663-Alexandrium_andersonii.AAC.1